MQRDKEMQQIQKAVLKNGNELVGASLFSGILGLGSHFHDTVNFSW